MVAPCYRHGCLGAHWQVVEFPGQADGRVGAVDAEAGDGDEEDGRVRVVCYEGAAQSIGYCVCCDHERDEEACRVDIHARQRGYDLTSAEHQARTNEHIRRPAIEQIRCVCSPIMLRRGHDLREVVCGGRVGFYFYGDQCKE